METKKPSVPGKSENEGIRRTPRRTHGGTGLILLFDGEVSRRSSRATMTSTTVRYPDSGPETSLPPSRSHAKPVALGVCSPLQWRNRPRFSRGSRARLWLEWTRKSTRFKERFLVTGTWDLCQEISFGGVSPPVHHGANVDQRHSHPILADAATQDGRAVRATGRAATTSLDGLFGSTWPTTGVWRRHRSPAGPGLARNGRGHFLW